MRIDAHLHFWKPDCGFDNRPIADNAFYRRDFLSAHVQPALDACGIDGVILVQTAPQREETDWLLTLASRDDRVWGVTAWVDLDSTACDFRRLSERPKVVGIRAQLRRIADSSFVNRPRVLANMANALRAGLNLTVLAEARHYGELGRAFDALPAGPITLNHLGLPFSQVDRGEWRDMMKRVAARPDTFVQFSGLPFLFGNRWQEPVAQTLLDDALDTLGIERLVFASDWPMLLRFATYEAWFACADAFAKKRGLSDDARDALFARNALRANPLLAVPVRSRAVAR